MSRHITLFSGYSQKENRTTNYCLLILKMLYEENPKFLAEVFTTLAGEELGERIGVKFKQQERKTSSVPDGLILQPAFTIYIETKNSDWFYDAQLEKHLEALDGETAGFKVLVALSSAEDDGSERFDAIRNLCKRKVRKTIAFEQVSFEELAEALRLPHLPKNLADATADFRAYLDEQGLLHSRKDSLDVVNCAGIPNDVLVGRVYICPATGGAYNHGRCRYFGMYRGKRVEKLAIIEAVVDVEDSEKARLKWQNIQGTDSQFILRARTSLNDRRPGEYPMRVFLLGELHDTDFRKDSPGGMLASKQYFDISALRIKDAADLATALRERTWSSLRSQGATTPAP